MFWGLVTKSSSVKALFCIAEDLTPPNPRREELESLLPSIYKVGQARHDDSQAMDKYISEHPDGYGLTQFRVAVQRYRIINNPSMRMVEQQVIRKRYLRPAGHSGIGGRSAECADASSGRRTVVPPQFMANLHNGDKIRKECR